MHAMTIGLQREIERGNTTAVRFVTLALRTLKPGELPDMIVGRPGQSGLTYEDGGRTAVVPVPTQCPKLYALANETGGVTVMLAEEY